MIGLGQAVSYVFEALFFIGVITFVVSSFVSAYHWFTFGSSKRVSMVLLTTYLVGGAILLIILSISLTTLHV